MSKEETLEFFSLLHQGVPPELWTPLWERQTKLSTWLQISEGPAAFAAAALGLATAEKDAYVSVSCATQAGGPKQRITSAGSAGIMGLWSDIDMVDKAHRKFDLPASQEEAMEILEECGLRPTIIIHSGHGLQAWWLFEKFWAFSDQDDHAAAHALSVAWNTTIKNIAALKGQTVDMVFDLSRVMRVPGTKNFKNLEAVVPVATILADGARYTIDAIRDKVIIDPDKEVDSTPKYVVDDLTFDPKAMPPLAKFEAAQANIENFKSSFNRTRLDMHDQTGSSYDLSLATLAAGVGWSDQEICDLLIATRRENNDRLKFDNPGYYRRTIIVARAARVYNVPLVISEATMVMDEAKEDDDREKIRDAKRSIFATISDLLGLEITQAIRYDSDPPSYRIITPGGAVTFSTGGQQMFNQGIFRTKMGDKVGVMTNTLKGADWNKLIQLILNALDHVEVGIESSEIGMIQSWLTDYMTSWPPGDDRLDSLRDGGSWLADGVVYFTTRQLKRWLFQDQQERIEVNDLVRMLRTMGCDVKTEAFRNPAGKTTSKSVWSISAGKVGL